MIGRTLFTVTAAAALWGGASAAAAQTGMCAEFNVDGDGLKFVYNPFNAAPEERDVALRVTRLNPAVTQVRFIIADPTPRGGDPKIGLLGPELYNLAWRQDEGRRVFVWGAERVTQTNHARVDFSGRTDQQVTQFRLRVPAGQPARADNQTERLEIRYECWSGDERLGSERAQLDNRVMLDMDVGKLFGAYIGGEGRNRGTIDFGELDVAGGVVSHTLAVSSVSTVPYEVAVDTQNGGELKQTVGAAGIPFTMRFAQLNVQDGDRLRCGETRIPSGDVHQLEITLDQGTTRNLPAGRNYRDTVTLTFTPRDGASIAPQTCRVLGGG